MALAVVLITACTTLTPAPQTEQVAFTMEGRMAIAFASGTEKDSSGKIRWEEYPNSTDITLSTPFGNALALVHLTPNESTYKGSDGSVVTEASPDMLFYRLFGMDLPIYNLRDWIGRPNQPLIKDRMENGWRVRVLDTFANPNLAKGLEISRTEPEVLTLSVWIDERSDMRADANNNANSEPRDIDLGELLPPPKTAPATPPRPKK